MLLTDETTDRGARTKFILDGIQRAASMPLERAITIPPGAYTDPGYYSLELRALKNDWIPVAHVSQLKADDSYMSVDVLGVAAVVTRDANGGYHVLSRVCPHRGTDILHPCFRQEVRGTSHRLVCPYHVWGFDLSGQLRTAPFMDQAEGFNRDDWRLTAFRSEIWNGFIFVNIDGEAPSLQEQYAEMSERVAPWKMADMELVYEETWHGDFNWKIMTENWSECYHHIGTHSKTLQPAHPAKDARIDPTEHGGFNQTDIPYGDNVQIEDLDRGMFRMFPAIEAVDLGPRCDNRIFVGYPCFLLGTNRDHVVWIRVLPVAENRCEVLTTLLLPRSTLAEPDVEEKLFRLKGMFRDFHKEDMEVNLAVHEGLAHAERLPLGRLSHLESPIWMFHRYLAKKLAALN